MSMRRNRPLTERMIRAARLDPEVYEEVERDTNATGQAATVVLIAAAAQAIAALISGSIGAAILSLIFVPLAWVVWSLITYWVGKNLFATSQTRVTPGEMLRTIGFAHTPGLLWIFTFLGILGGLIGFVVFVWMLVAGYIAVRQAMDFSGGRAIATILVGIPIYAVFLIIRSIIF
jgi:hypothetical protein